MENELTLRPIGYIQTGFADKFGIPRQGRLAQEITGTIILEPEFRKDGILKGIEAYSHLWLIWGFSENDPDDWSVTVRPPKLGGKKRLGIFATRSPRRPNPIGLTAVALLSVEQTQAFGTMLHIGGADMVSGTPIYDIKPYIPYCDAIPEAAGGFSVSEPVLLKVRIPDQIRECLSPAQTAAIQKILEADPRPGYARVRNEPYHIVYDDLDIAFTVTRENTAEILAVSSSVQNTR